MYQVYLCTVIPKVGRMPHRWDTIPQTWDMGFIQKKTTVGYGKKKAGKHWSSLVPIKSVRRATRRGWLDHVMPNDIPSRLYTILTPNTSKSTFRLQLCIVVTRCEFQCVQFRRFITSKFKKKSDKHRRSNAAILNKTLTFSSLLLLIT